MSRAEPPLIPGAGRGGLGLSLVLALISLLAALEIMAATTAARALGEWPARLAGSVTLAAAGQGLETSDAAAARAAETLSHDSRVAAARILEPDPDDAVAARLMGETGVGPDGAPPRLLTLSARPGTQISPTAAQAMLRAEGIAAAADGHGQLDRLVVVGAGGAGLMLLLLAVLVPWLTAAGVGRAFAASRARVLLLRQLGSTDAALAQPFGQSFGRAAVAGALIGAVAALIPGAILLWSPQTAIGLASQGLPVPPMDVWDLIAGLAWPPAAILLAVPIAHWAAGRAVRSLG